MRKENASRIRIQIRRNVESKLMERVVVVQLSVTDSKSAYVRPPASEVLPPNAPNVQD